MNRLVIGRSEPLEFEINGLVIEVPPLTRGSMRAVLSLDPETDAVESEMEASVRRSLQLEAIVGEKVWAIAADGTRTELPARQFLNGLEPDQEIQILWAVMGQAFGHDPRAAVAIQQALKKKGLTAALHVSPDLTPTPTA